MSRFRLWPYQAWHAPKHVGFPNVRNVVPWVPRTEAEQMREMARAWRRVVVAMAEAQNEWV